MGYLCTGILCSFKKGCSPICTDLERCHCKCISLSVFMSVHLSRYYFKDGLTHICDMSVLWLSTEKIPLYTIGSISPEIGWEVRGLCFHSVNRVSGDILGRFCVRLLWNHLRKFSVFLSLLWNTHMIWELCVLEVILALIHKYSTLLPYFLSILRKN